jgi:hypothetical protein
MGGAYQLPQVQRVAVIDDDPEYAILTRLQIEEAGFEAYLPGGGFASLEHFSQLVGRNAQAAVCDYKLRRTAHYAPFDGAEAVAHLFDQRIPAILVSQYTKNESQFSIRQWRKKVPVLLTRQKLDPTSIRVGLWKCAQEIGGEVPPERKPRRAIVRIDEVTHEEVTAFVPQWRPEEAVYFLRSLVPESLQPHLLPEQRFSASVNISAIDSDELFFEDFRLAPEPDEEDGLA